MRISLPAVPEAFRVPVDESPVVPGLADTTSEYARVQEGSLDFHTSLSTNGALAGCTLFRVKSTIFLDFALKEIEPFAVLKELPPDAFGYFIRNTTRTPDAKFPARILFCDDPGYDVGAFSDVNSDICMSEGVMLVTLKSRPPTPDPKEDPKSFMI